MAGGKRLVCSVAILFAAAVFIFQSWRHPQHGSELKHCFPADATASLRDGTRKTMAQLRVGDHVATADVRGRITFEPIYFFAHRKTTGVGSFLRINITTTAAHSPSKFTLELTPGHFVHVSPPGAAVTASWAKHRRPVPARAMTPGSTLWVAPSGSSDLAPGRVASIEFVNRKGAFDPYTLGGDVVVNGVFASCHHDWMLFESIIPTGIAHLMPGASQKLLYPLRALYEMFGPSASELLQGQIAAFITRKSAFGRFIRRTFGGRDEQKFEL